MVCWFQNSFCFGCTFKTELGRTLEVFVPQNGLIVLNPGPKQLCYMPASHTCLSHLALTPASHTYLLHLALTPGSHTLLSHLALEPSAHTCLSYIPYRVGSNVTDLMGLVSTRNAQENSIFPNAICFAVLSK